MKIGFHSPYIDSFGGGERYVLTLASHWSRKYEVSVFWDNPEDLKKSEIRFGLDLSRVTCIPDVFKNGNLLSKIRTSRKYDCLFFLSDGSVPSSFAKVNILHFQVPFVHVSMPVWKSALYRQIVCNSVFTEKFLDPAVRVQKTVIYPPVDTAARNSTNKAKIILTVGRLGGLYNAKKHDILIDAFRKLYTEKGLKSWRFVLAGSLSETDADALRVLKESAAGLPVEFRPNCSYKDLISLYEQASVYWHAAGYGEDTPEHMEHFGITTVEAMNAGCIPVTYNGGGQPEIIDNGKDGVLWNDSTELLEKSLEVIENEKTQKAFRVAAVEKAKLFSVRRFTDAFDTLLSEL